MAGDVRESCGHAWLLTGYDHTDGQSQWKYQGHFVTVNSWGREWPEVALRRPGLCSLPFAFVLSEGVQAFAMRLERM